MRQRRLIVVLTVMLLALALMATPFAMSGVSLAAPVNPGESAAVANTVSDGSEDAPASTAQSSHRLIVQLESPSLTEWSAQTGRSRGSDGRLDLRSSAAQAYMAQLEAEQESFVRSMQSALPGARVSSYRNERGESIQSTYQLVFNGLAIDPGRGKTEATLRALQNMPGVRAVYRDYARTPDLYSSLNIINAPGMWNNSAIGGQGNAGAGIKVASMDGGVHHDAPMFDGTGYTYPAGYPLGDTSNTNGKIIVSRAYFRDWDPPAAGDENPWPGENGTSHGVHTASTAVGNPVIADYLGYTVPISGVAPRAYVMSYRVFYYSVTADGSFYDAEGIAALEDIVADDADVVNNSWGGGPSSSGGMADALDAALINASNAGVFVSMSAGNAGPGGGTTDHPSADYIIAAATTTTGTLASGRLSVSAPEPVPPDHENMAFTLASFGGSLEPGQVYTYDFLPGAAVDPTNFEGCNAWPAGTFEGKAAIVSRGVCEFGVKVLNAEQAGAEFVVVHNHEAGGEELISMGPGVVGDQVTIPSVFVGYTNGTRLTEWYADNGDASQITLDMSAFQAGNTPDILAGFSSRGPGVGNVLKPDIAAPGVNILAQGYTPNTTGEARHLGYGQVSGTSMAAPHVSGAAAMLRQIHPDWSNADIKSALMTTSKYLDVWNDVDMTDPAQPLDMGAGRLDLTNAADPGVILDPPSVSFGAVHTMTAAQSITVTVRSVADTPETYQLSFLYTGDGFPGTEGLDGFTVEPEVVVLAAGESADVVVTFDPATSAGVGDNQGYLIMDGATHEAHMPVWARVTYTADADVLIIDNDGSSSLGLPDYTPYYTSALEALGHTYEVLDADAEAGAAQNFLDVIDLLAYPVVIHHTGDNFYPDSTFTVPTPLTFEDMDALNTYAQNGGIIVAMGQDMAAVLTGDTSNPPFYYGFTLGATWLQDAIADYDVVSPTFTIDSTGALPLAGVTLDLSNNGDGAANQYYVDEIESAVYVTNSTGTTNPDYVAVLQHQNEDNIDQGTVGMAHRQQPTLEEPEITFTGRTMYMTFGLEGVNNVAGPDSTDGTPTTREELLDRVLTWGMDNPTATLAAAQGGTPEEYTFTAAFASNVPEATALSYRWDFGDGSAYVTTSENTVSHTYASCTADLTARVEVTDSLGNNAIGTLSGFCEPTAVGLVGINAGSSSGFNGLALVALVALGAGFLGLWSRRKSA